jgi:hypothetical protein
MSKVCEDLKVIKRNVARKLIWCSNQIVMPLFLLCTSLTSGRADERAISPLYGVSIPAGYRQWELISPALEDEPLNELRAVVGNKIAIEAYRRGSLPFPDGAILVKLAWRRQQLSEFKAATVPGAPTTVQVMVKNSRRYKASGGWGFGRFVNGASVDVAQHQTCFGCHQASASGHDYVFTRFAP